MWEQSEVSPWAAVLALKSKASLVLDQCPNSHIPLQSAQLCHEKFSLHIVRSIALEHFDWSTCWLASQPAALLQVLQTASVIYSQTDPPFVIICQNCTFVILQVVFETFGHTDSTQTGPHLLQERRSKYLALQQLGQLHVVGRPDGAELAQRAHKRAR